MTTAMDRAMRGALLFAALAAGSPAAAQDAIGDYAWSENAGFFSAAYDTEATGASASVVEEGGEPVRLAGFLWAENVGWVSLGSPAHVSGRYTNAGTDYGVNVDAVPEPAGDGFRRRLTGTAWSESVGAVRFLSLDDVVRLGYPDDDASAYLLDSGDFTGFAWSENLGWVTLRNGTFYGLGTYPRVSVGAAEAAEGACQVVFQVKLSKAPQRGSVTITYETQTSGIEHPATPGTDFTEPTGPGNTLELSGTAQSFDLVIPVDNDRAAETDEQFRLRLTGLSGPAVFGEREALGTIRNDDFTLLVLTSGAGAVRAVPPVLGSPTCGPAAALIGCDGGAGVCSAVYTTGEQVTLEAVPAVEDPTSTPPTPPTAFLGWGGAAAGCGTRLLCSLSLGTANLDVSAVFEVDSDRDGVPDSADNCLDVYNPDQRDADGNGLGDMCDGDIDGDGVPNAVDNCPTVVNADQADANRDERGDACQVRLADAGQLLCHDVVGTAYACDPQVRIATATTIAFHDNGASADTITDDAAGLVAAGFAAADLVSVSGSRRNNGLFAVAAVAADTLTLAPGLLADEAAGAGVTLRAYEPLYGQDGHAPPRVPALGDLGDGTAADAATGLIWQRAGGAATTWFKAMGLANPQTGTVEGDVCGSLVLGGQDDWRLPSRQELLTLLRVGGSPPYDPAAFPTMAAAPYWTADRYDYRSTNPAGTVWTVSFAGPGSVDLLVPDPTSPGGYTRCVRGRTFSSTALLQDNGDGTVTDERNGLVWQQHVDPARATWDAARLACSLTRHAGYDDWRLPKLKELLGLLDFGVHSPAINLALFPETPSDSYFWSDDPNVMDPTRAWAVNFREGTFLPSVGKDSANYVRCVRGRTLHFNDLSPAPAFSGRTVSFEDDPAERIRDSAAGLRTAGFAAGDTILVSGSGDGENDGLFTVTAASDEYLTLASPAGRPLVPQPAGRPISIARLSAFAGTGLSFASAPSRILDAGAGFLAAGFAPGDLVQVAGAATPGNNGTFAVTAVAAGALTVAGALAAEPAGAQVVVAKLNLAVQDGGTGRSWEQAAHGPFTWQEALAYCETTLNQQTPPLGGRIDWRLPDIKELETIADLRLARPASPPDPANPAIDTGVFRVGSGDALKFWSSTSRARYPEQVVGMHFDQGGFYMFPKAGEKRHVRCVRGGFEAVLAVDVVARWDAVPDGGRRGRVTATPMGNRPGSTGIDCFVRAADPGPGAAGLDAGQCSDIYGTDPPTEVTLSADPLRGTVLAPYDVAVLQTEEERREATPTVFAGWSGGGCEAAPVDPLGSGCTVVVREDVIVAATFRQDADLDRDNVWDSADNCPSAYNPDQVDTDQDGRGDACEVRLPDTGQQGHYTSSRGEDADYEINPPAYRSRSSVSAATISFAGTVPARILDAGLGFAAAGFAPGDTVVVSGSLVNDGSYTLARVEPGALSLVATDVLRDQPAGAMVTIANGLGGVTYDRNTRLVWQAADDGELYTWYEAAGVASIYNPQGAVDVCRALNLSLHSDWRLPTKQELLSIADYDRASPAIDDLPFPGTGAEWYWAADTYAGSDEDRAWAVDFSSGAAGFLAKSDERRVRCVRETGLGYALLEDNGDGTVTDTATGLTWQQSDEDNAAGRTWEQSLEYCEATLNGRTPALGDRSDWRLPNARELASIVRDERLPGQAAFPPAFAGGTAAGYWTSTTSVQNPVNAWYVDFATGSLLAFASKESRHLVRCVRGGAAGSVGNADLSVSVADDPDPVVCSGEGCGAANGDIVYTVTVTNNGPDEARDVTLSDTLPAGTSLVGVSAPAPTACTDPPEIPGTVVCSTPALAAGASVDVTITVTPPVIPGQVVDTATVACRTNDAVPENDAAAESTWAGRAQNTLTVSVLGFGGGSVQSDLGTPPDIACGGDCSQVYPLGTRVVLTATPDPSSVFQGWSGGCAGSDATCELQVNADAAVSATFVVDSDDDGVPEARDNCAGVYNPGQGDMDRDGVGDACDTEDLDGDGVANAADVCVETPDPDQVDTDGDGVGDACELRLADTGQDADHTASFGEDSDYEINPPAFSGAALVRAATLSFSGGTADTILDSEGRFLEAGFAPGDRVRVLGSALNDGTYDVATVEAGVLTLGDGAGLSNESAGATVAVTNGTLLVADDLAFSASNPAAILDARGRFFAAGFAPGDRIAVSGTLHAVNDGTFTIATLTPERITLAAGEALATQPLPATLRASTISFSAPDTILDAGSGFLAAGFDAGDRIAVAGSALNDGDYLIRAVGPGTITLDVATGIRDEAAGAPVLVTETALVTLLGLGNGTLVDRNTHLLWQRADDGALRTWAEAGAYCAGLVLGGRGGVAPGTPPAPGDRPWRLPAKEELLDLPDYGATGPASAPGSLADVGSEPYWTSTSSGADTAFQVHFGTGASAGAAKSERHRVRCVRGGGRDGEGVDFHAQYATSPDGSVLDGVTGLSWEKGNAQNAAARTWEQALAYCETLPDGAGDWRLPTARELSSLADSSRYPALSSSWFTFTPEAWSWSSTTDEGATGKAWAVRFSGGDLASQAKDALHHVRCVRGGRSGSIGEADLALAGGSGPDPVIAGRTLTYTLTVQNLGPNDVAGAALAGTLPQGATYLGADLAACVADGEAVGCSLGDIAAGGASLTVTMTVLAPSATGAATAAFAVSTLTNDPVPANDRVELSTAVDADQDLDGMADSVDNCPAVPNFSDLGSCVGRSVGATCLAADECAEGFACNTDQEDFNGNGIGDACDPDIDGDGLANALDNCAIFVNPNQMDTDGDGDGDACDPDVDGDEVANAEDNCPLLANPGGADTDGDDVGDACEIFLPDTGQTECYTAAGEKVVCGTAGLAAGQDGSYTLHPPSLSGKARLAADTISFVNASPATILDSAGGFVVAGFAPGDIVTVVGSSLNDGAYTAAAVEPGSITLAAGATLRSEGAGAPVTLNAPGDTVRDVRTGLVWQRKSAVAFLSQSQAADHCAALQLGAYPGGLWTDWRLPSREELLSLTRYGVFNPAIDTALFPGTASEVFWTASDAAPGTGWAVDFYAGDAAQVPATQPARVRCVRGLPLVYADLAPDPALLAVLDHGTGLVWQDGSTAAAGSWEQALAYCESLVLPAAGTEAKDDWRLPNVRELASLSVAAAAFTPPPAAEVHWSSTTSAPTPLSAWGVSFGDGRVVTRGKDQALHVRCVRSGAGGAVGNADLALAMSAGVPDPVTAGREVAYELTVTNLGEFEALGATVTDTLPEGAVFLDSDGADCSATGREVTCSVGTVAPRPAGSPLPTPVSFTIRARAPRVRGDVFNVATAAATTFDAVADNDTASDGATTVQYHLTVLKSGDGAATVTSTAPAGDIVCDSGCVFAEHAYPPPPGDTLSVTLEAVPDPTLPSFFYSWQVRDCTGIDPPVGLAACPVVPACSASGPCVATVDGDVFVTAFVTPYRLVTTLDGAGAGAVASLDPLAGDVSCGSDCEQLYMTPASVTLSATAEQGSLFQGWGGACAGTAGSLCTVAVAGDVAVTATFLPDEDDDGVTDTADNCTSVANPDQLDVDGDLRGDLCDNCVWVPNADQADADLNGTGDVCGAVDLARTGQLTAHRRRDDGSTQAGVPWPAARFALRGAASDMVLDRLTGLTWLRDGNCMGARYPDLSDTGRVSWADARAFVLGVNSGLYPLCDGGNRDWRLPNVNELQSLLNAGQQDSALWLRGQGFVLPPGSFWSSTYVQAATLNAWAVSMTAGQTRRLNGEDGRSYVWLVRGASDGPAEVWRTGQVASSAPGDDASWSAGTAWPDPRLVDVGDLLKDELTGLFWTKNAWAPGPAVCKPGTAKTWTAAMAYVACLNAQEYLGHTDWRLPNRTELRSLLHYGTKMTSTWLRRRGVAFPPAAALASYRYWTSTTNAGLPERAWVVGLSSGLVTNVSLKTGLRGVWPVRGGSLLPH